MPRQPVVLVIDVGLTNCKASLFDMQGRLIARASRRHPTLSPRPGWSEQNPEDWWSAVKVCIRALPTTRNNLDVIALSVTGHMHGLIGIDSEGHALTNCWTLFDRRAESEAQLLNQTLGAETIYSSTGARIEAYTPAAKILWLKRHHPDIFTQTAVFFAVKDMVRHQLGGDPVTDRIDAAGTLLYDLKAEQWAEDILQSVGVRQEQLCEIRDSCADSGSLSRKAASELGLQAGIPLIVGAGDDVGVVGAGVMRSGQAVEHIGTAASLVTCLSTPVLDPEQRLEVYPHVVPDLYLLGGATNAAGLSLAWARRLLSGEQRTEGELALTYPPPEGATSPPIYLPFIRGERGLLWDSAATGALLGLREEHTPADLARAVYEGVALSLKEIIVATHSLGVRPTEVVAGASMAYAGWDQMRADAYGLPLLVPDTRDPADLGAALLALVNQQVFSDLREATEKCCRVSQRMMPNPRWVDHYSELHKVYQAAICACRPLFPKLSPA